ncbi:adenylate cyclase [Bradyrhizobium sp. WBOS7]|uniref:Adenylate cyclase n=1 Tax=Bradyrhizobium betae TaxID=244734 RepID=A0AAE9SY47_9BRAD|nr:MULTISPECIES: TOMM precursor leader peptide-binding protein [Bradyrhizobium]MDD1573475.1 adenylate cyclase [Bradyrhizobium sp. WBOS1]UUO39278.1 adenylate cyclase [Bradyrhizobium sp. WBOS01]MDD1530450.1 adenylate cyclase [Bradyrhizobium sp. WBOS2]MDD1579610.1 adenylate cyclase [Bradyrhizobium sp. WBOS7]MDD1602989.1 adenylate cyclase [Bradyrhizobium sp. WBOS16]
MQAEVVDYTASCCASPVRLCIKPNFSVELVEPMHVYLLSEHASHVLTGQLYCAIVPLLDGRYTIDEIHSLLSGTISSDVVDHVIARLSRLGFLVEAVDGTAPGVAAFWSELGFDPGRVVMQLRQSRISLMAVGNVSVVRLLTLISEAGLVADIRPVQRSGDAAATLPDLQVVVTDDYLRPEIEEINRIALKTRRPWMLVKPVGSVIWLGPIFVPCETGCWQCLAHRLRGNLEVKESIHRQRKAQADAPICLPTSRPALPSTVDLALHWTTTEIAKWLAGRTLGPEDGNVRAETLAGKILTLDHLSHGCQTHSLPHRPQCSCCGDPALIARRGFQPIMLESSPKRYVEESGHRSMTPEQTVARYQHLISPVSGVVTELTRISDPANHLVHTYRSSHSRGTVGSLRGLRRILRHTSSGKGKTSEQARASGLCEAIERYSFIYQGDEPRINATLAEMGENALRPECCLQFSEAQYADRETLNANSAVGNNWIPMRFDPGRPIDWTPVWSLTHGHQKFLPTATCYQWYPLPRNHEFCRADSNGNAAGNNLEEAICQGFLEVVERDCVALWWYNRLRRPAVDLASFDDPYFRDLEQYYRDVGREMWLLDLTADLGIPVVAAVSRRITGSSERLIVGYGAHFDPAVAVTRALTEMSQVGLELDKIPDELIDAEGAEWLLGARIEDKPYLVPDRLAPATKAVDFKSAWTGDIRDDVDIAVAACRRIGLEVLVLDLTRPDIGLNVVKVVVPGMRFFWKRFAPGRLYDVPVRLAWLNEPTPEALLNPTPMPF